MVSHFPEAGDKITVSHFPEAANKITVSHFPEAADKITVSHFPEEGDKMQDVVDPGSGIQIAPIDVHGTVELFPPRGFLQL